MLDQKLKGIRIDPRQPKVTIMAYADDVTIFLTPKEEISIVREALGSYQESSGAKTNLAKSATLAGGGWDTKTDILGINYQQHIKILGIHYHPGIERTVHNNWELATRAIRAQATTAYHRELGLHQRIQYTHSHLMARTWYIAQTLPLPTTYERQLSTTINWFVWHGSIFKVLLSTLHKRKQDGGWNLINIAAKCGALFYNRMRTQERKGGDNNRGMAETLGTA
jgi:hypothetical protein